jgi:NAD(P)-dependent dehydrogenase (short-subunit alcohol dehydrogenase family)
MNDAKVWFVTGAGRGIGRALTETALAVDAGARHFGRLDVVVNNAGYGLVGAIEEVAEAEARAIIDTNLLGALWVSQAALPHLRRQGSGHIVQISTVGAVGAMPTMGLHNASKWALEGFSEALAAEVAPFGIRVTIAELGGFAADWAASSMQFADPLPAYDPLRTQLYGTSVVPWDRAAPVDGPDAAPLEPGPNATRVDPTPNAAPVEPGPHAAPVEPGPDAAPEATDPPPAVAAAAIRAHVDAPAGPLRLLVGADAATLASMALAARRDDYARGPAFAWPPAPPADR